VRCDERFAFTVIHRNVQQRSSVYRCASTNHSISVPLYLRYVVDVVAFVSFQRLQARPRPTCFGHEGRKRCSGGERIGQITFGISVTDDIWFTSRGCFALRPNNVAEKIEKKIGREEQCIGVG